MANVYTYSAKDLLMSCGTHAVTGYVEDTFVSIEFQGDGTTVHVGADGEVNRSIDLNQTALITISLSHASPSNAYFLAQYKKDRVDGKGMFPFSMKDLTGQVTLNAKDAWVVNIPSQEYGKTMPSKEWVIQTGKCEFYDF